MISLFSTVPTKELQSESADENQIRESAIPPKELQSESAKNLITENRSLTSCAFSLVVESEASSSVPKLQTGLPAVTTHVTAAAI
jgi:hypothetical protein